jgi:hypothetical protein
MMPVTKLITAMTSRLAANIAEGNRGTKPVLRNSKKIGIPIAREIRADRSAMTPNSRNGRW